MLQSSFVELWFLACPIIENEVFSISGIVMGEWKLRWGKLLPLKPLAYTWDWCLAECISEGKTYNQSSQHAQKPTLHVLAAVAITLHAAL